MLTADRLSDLFSAPIAIEENDGYFYARPAKKVESAKFEVE
jgi:hypothetical protein